MAFLGLQIGIELEVLLTPQDPPAGGFKDFEHFCRMVTQKLNIERPHNMAKMHVDVDGSYAGGNENLEWSMTDDETLDELENIDTGRWAAEFTTPILQYVISQSWRADIRAFWNFLESYMLIETHPKCGTHIHMSPLEGVWPLLHLKKICWSVLWFEEAFEVLILDSRRKNHYCQSNRFENERFSNKSNTECFAMIHECENNQDIVDLMNN